MKFVSTRELRNRPGEVRKLVEKEDLVLTANGKPIAMILGIDEEDVEETAMLVRQARAQIAVSRMRKRAASLGLDKMSLSEINAEIQAVRAKRKAR
ncbi:MAG: type II toxin-antitoxin system prevent-host-death family antitoxin [Terriglobales bacterium]